MHDKNKKNTGLKAENLSKYIFILGLCMIIYILSSRLWNLYRLDQVNEQLKSQKQTTEEEKRTRLFKLELENKIGRIVKNKWNSEKELNVLNVLLDVPVVIVPNPVILDEYKELFMQNKDMIGWLTIDDTVIDYPVMQTPKDENFYSHLDFNKQDNVNGCLIMDTDSNVGIGLKEFNYEKGTKPSHNLIIHGHTMKSGAMFGGLKKYAKESYGLEHKIIKFDSLFEKREYELISTFYSQVYYPHDGVFKYYTFFNANNQEEFDYWYTNIKEMALYDTGVTAEYGDEFITLSCCAYHVEDGRFVVIAKRIK